MKQRAPLIPRGVHALAWLALLLLLLPLLALALRVPWRHLPALLAEPSTQHMLGITLTSAALSTIVVCALGVPLALSLQVMPRGGNLARALVLLPLAMPPVVSGLALGAAFGRKGLLAPLLDQLHVQLAFSFAGVVLAHTFVSLPFLVVTVDAALRQFDAEVWYSAQSVGLSPTYILRRIVLPALRPAIATGAGLAFARSLGEFGTTLTFAGSLPGVTRTLPVGIYLERETDPTAAYGLAAILVLLAIMMLALAMLPGLFRAQPPTKAVPLQTMDLDALARLSAPNRAAQNLTLGKITIPAGSCVGVIGPNGAGKTTLLRKIAGRIPAKVFGDGARLPNAMWQRGIVMLTQSPGLPPSATVLETIAMVHDEPDALLQAAGMEALGAIPNQQLSGGQAAQVALLRALAARSSILLLDEPLAAIDVHASQRWRRMLQVAQRNRTIMMVSHNPTDVATLSSHVLILEAEKTALIRATEEEFQRPSSDFSASFVGLNRLEGTVTAVRNGVVELDCQGLTVVGTSDESLNAAEQAIAVCAPEAVTLKVPQNRTTQESARNQWEGRITSIEIHKNVVFVRVKFAAASITLHTTQASAIRLQLRVGANVICAVKALNVHVYRSPAPSQH
ncbi:ATP-binding cassette domain-containing protein [Corynebacterium gerontici]|uniref:2-aminoethylphosphonate import ATP-binding protein PhnT n=1 Tax=Corynebacterium gerontici TaxID=2079234 RepID=A0A3G6IZU0_9CORY|nr:ATP-binding cassette domain-containing protein [Corynebacterium gerontici]AZA11217.1 Putative 2-aminoethylphosphonate import ATP-binding protein PhnT [Corynebacterium gerontici]